MRRAEERAQKGDVGSMDTATDQMRVSEKGTIWDMVVPIGALIVFAVLCLMYSGGYWGDDPAYHSFAASLGNSSASEALVWSSFGALVVAFLMFVPRKVVSFRDFMDGSVEGMKMMLPANIILVLAWTISGVCRDLLQTPLFVESLVTTGGFSAMWLPAAVFALAAFLSFSTGTAWGTFAVARFHCCAGGLSDPNWLLPGGYFGWLCIRRPLLANFRYDYFVIGRGRLFAY